MLITKIADISKMPDGVIRAKIHYKDGTIENRRVYKGDGNTSVAIYAKRKRNRGYWLHNFDGQITGIEPIIVGKKSETDVWRKSWEKALKMLEGSGMWEDLQGEIRAGLDIGFDKIKQVYEMYSIAPYDDQAVLKEIQQIDTRLVNTNDDGRLYLNTSIVWRMDVPARIKKMYFGKRVSGDYLRQIAEAMQNKQTLHLPRVKAGYDVTFEYNAERNTAWYSEEYRGCGNGHYYLALNETHALFCEDD
jgi:hypothetical protein